MSRVAPSVCRLVAGLLVLLPLAAACGKKGPPLPPLVRVPAAPVEIRAERRALSVDVQFGVPAANTDGSRPANIQRVEVYALNGAGPASASDVLAKGARVGAVDVKAPADPNDTIDADEPDSDAEALVGPGIDQGATAHVRDLLTAATTAGGATTRTYVGVSITTRGRRGTSSAPVAVSLAAAPDAPVAPSITYTETTIAVTWPAADGDEVAYHVYDVSRPAATASAPAPPASAPATPVELRLDMAPLTAPHFDDTRLTWNAERCYVVRSVRLHGGLAVEGDASPKACVTLTDTFAPAAPTGLTAVASEGAINLIWAPSAERDLAGYRVLRTTMASGEVVTVTPSTISESSFTDTVAAGVRYAYAVQAVDTAGNTSAASAAVEETAR